MSLVDLIHQVKSVLPKRYGGTGNPYGWGAAVVQPYRNGSGGSLPLGTIVKLGGSSSGVVTTDVTEDSTAVLGVVVGYYSGGDGSTFVVDAVASNDQAAIMIKGTAMVLLAEDVTKGEYAAVSSAADGTAKGVAAIAAGVFGVFETAGDLGKLTRVQLFGASIIGTSNLASPLTTKGDLWGRDTADARVPVGSNGQYLKADSTDAQGVTWTTLQSYWQCDVMFRSVSAGEQWWIRIPYDCTVEGWDITANASGSAVVDVWMDAYANFPPTVADTIAGAEKPTLSAARANQDTSLSTWTTALVRGRYLMFNVDSVSGIANLYVALYGTRTV